MPHPTRTLSIHSPAIPQINDPSALTPILTNEVMLE